MDNVTREVLLSVIVPIYKVEKYINQCVNSILKQTYKNIEIILVDDGSPDNCGSICDQYEKMDSRIKVIHIENGGVYNARNCGLHYSSGDYIAFIDGDDYLYSEDNLMILLNEAKMSFPDIVVGNYYKNIADEIIETNSHGFDRYTDTSSQDFRFKGFFSKGNLAYIWGKIYKRSFIISNDLIMKPYVYSEDKLFNIECYLKKPTYSFIDDKIYVYRSNEASISYQYKKDFHKIWLEISSEIYNILQSMGSDEDYYDMVAYNIFFAIFFSCKQEYISSNHSRKQITRELQKFSDNNLCKLFMKYLARGKYTRDISSYLWKIMMRFFSIGFRLKNYFVLSLGIKILIDYNIDGKLSSTGKPNKIKKM